MQDLPPTSWQSPEGRLYEADQSFGQKMVELAIEMTESAFHAHSFKKLSKRTHRDYVETTSRTLLEDFAVVEKQGRKSWFKVPRRLSTFRRVSTVTKHKESKGDKDTDPARQMAIDRAYIDQL